MATRPRGHASSMPAYTYDRADLVGQVETEELDRLYRERNRVKLPATPSEISRMNQALNWPWELIRGPQAEEIRRAVQLGALWVVMRYDVKKKCKELGLARRTFYRRKMEGLRIIATELWRRKVPVS